MNSEPLAECRHRGRRRPPGGYDCHSPKLIGLAIVSADDCRSCLLRDHEPPAAPAPRQHLVPCVHWGDPLPGHPGRHACGHPKHRETTWAQCRTCPDYVFPFLTPTLPDSLVRRLVSLDKSGQAHGWWHLRNVQRVYRQLARRAARAPLGGADHGAGRGIVIVGGGHYFASAYVAIRVLRHVGCELPVELWHFDGELDDARRSIVAPHGVACVNADEAARQRPFRFLRDHWWRGWQLKPYAVLHSRFAEVLYLDADCYPTRDPSFLFRLPAYRECGAVFWPDLPQPIDPAVWRIFGVKPANPPLESGQMLINKSACARELRLALWYNEHADYVYRHLWGDKDTFNVAWNLLGRPFAMLHPVSAWDVHTILQHDQKGRVLFQHRCRDKFRLGDDAFPSNPHPEALNQRHPRLAHEDFCFAALAELRDLLDA